MRQIASWNPARDVWELDRGCLLCEHLDVFSGTWPTSGMTRGGRAYELPMPAPHTNGSGSSSSLGLPTPTATPYGSNQSNSPGAAVRPSLEGVARNLLPTPRTTDMNGPGAHGRGGLDLRTAVTLLPTPRATDGTKGGPNQRGSSGDLMLPSAVMHLPNPRHGASTPTPSPDGNES